MKTKHAKRGRPAKAPVEGQRNPLGFRVTADMKRRLEKSAAEAGRSQSQQAEFLLGQALQLFDDPATYRMFLLLSQAKAFIEEDAGKSVMDDHETRAAVRQCWIEIIKRLLSTPSKPAANDGLLSMVDAGTLHGTEVANSILNYLRSVAHGSAENRKG